VAASAERKPRADQIHELNEADAPPAASEGGTSKAKLQEVAKQVLAQVKSAQMHQIPMLPNVAARAMELATKSEVSVKELETIIQPDPMITARILAIANSPLYSVGSPVKNLRNAIMRLGVTLMRDILYQTVAEAHIFRGAAEKILRWQRVHAVAVAYLVRDLESKITDKVDSGFLCGLMHDIGEVILHQAFEKNPPVGLSREETESVIALIHPHIGHAVAERWRLPEAICEAIRRHHIYRGYEAGSGYSAIGNLIALADHLAIGAGIGERGPETVRTNSSGRHDEVPLEAADLGFDEEQFHALSARAIEIKGSLGL
jgi:HD-like signal output (HDOD) protein